MTYNIEQKFVSFKDQYIVTDESRKVLYKVTSPLFAVTSRFQFFDVSGTEVAYARRVISQIPGFIWYTDKAHADNEHIRGVLEDEVKLTKHNYKVTLQENVIWKVEGSFFAWDFTVKSKDESLIAVISKNTVDFKEFYKIEVGNEKDALNVFICVVLIDNAAHSQRPFRLFK